VAHIRLERVLTEMSAIARAANAAHETLRVHVGEPGRRVELCRCQMETGFGRILPSTIE
jgi:hypothetical protein